MDSPIVDNSSDEQARNFIGPLPYKESIDLQDSLSRDSVENYEKVDIAVVLNSKSTPTSLAKKRLKAYSNSKQSITVKKKVDKKVPYEDDKTEKEPESTSKILYPDERAKAVISEIEEIKKREAEEEEEKRNNKETEKIKSSERSRSRSLSIERRNHFKKREIKVKNLRRADSLEDPSSLPSSLKKEEKKPQHIKSNYPKSWHEYKEQNLSISKDKELKRRLLNDCSNVKNKRELFSKMYNFHAPSPFIDEISGQGNVLKNVPLSFVRVTKCKPQVTFNVNYRKNKESFLNRTQLFQIIPKERRQFIENLINSAGSKTNLVEKPLITRQWYHKSWKKVRDAECKVLESSVGLSFLQTYSDEEEAVDEIKDKLKYKQNKTEKEDDETIPTKIDIKKAKDDSEKETKTEICTPERKQYSKDKITRTKEAIRAIDEVLEKKKGERKDKSSEVAIEPKKKNKHNKKASSCSEEEMVLKKSKKKKKLSSFKKDDEDTASSEEEKTKKKMKKKVRLKKERKKIKIKKSSDDSSQDETEVKKKKKKKSISKQEVDSISEKKTKPKKLNKVIKKRKRSSSAEFSVDKIQNLESEIAETKTLPDDEIINIELPKGQTDKTEVDARKNKHKLPDKEEILFEDEFPLVKDTLDISKTVEKQIKHIPVWESDEDEDKFPSKHPKLNNSWESDEEIFERGRRSTRLSDSFDLEMPLNIPLKKRRIDVDIDDNNFDIKLASEELDLLELDKMKLMTLMKLQEEEEADEEQEEEEKRPEKKKKRDRWDKKNSVSDKDSSLEVEYEEFMRALNSEDKPKSKVVDLNEIENNISVEEVHAEVNTCKIEQEPIANPLEIHSLPLFSGINLLQPPPPPPPEPVEVKPVPVPSPKIDIDKLPKPLINLSLSANITLDIASKVNSPTLTLQPVTILEKEDEIVSSSQANDNFVVTSTTQFVTPTDQLKTEEETEDAIVQPFSFSGMVLPTKRVLLDNSNLKLGDSDDEDRRQFKTELKIEEEKPPVVVNTEKPTTIQLEQKVEEPKLEESKLEESKLEEPKLEDSKLEKLPEKAPREDTKIQVRESKTEKDRNNSLSPKRKREEESPKKRSKKWSPSPPPRRRDSPIRNRRRSPPRREYSPKRRSPIKKRYSRRSISPGYRKYSPPSPRRRSPRRSPSPKTRKRRSPSVERRSVTSIRHRSPPEVRRKSPVSSPLDTLKRSIADSTISDDLLIPQQHYPVVDQFYKNVDMGELKPIETTYANDYNNYQQYIPPSMMEHQYGEEISKISTPNVVPVPEVPTNNFVQVGNMVQIVPVDIPAKIEKEIKEFQLVKSVETPEMNIEQPMVDDVEEYQETVPISAEKTIEKNVEERRIEREQRRQEKERKRKEKEKRRREKEKQRQIRLKLKTENMIKRALQLEVAALAEDEDISTFSETPTQWPPPVANVVKEFGRGILMGTGQRRDKAGIEKKSVKFADGIRPGDGTSTSGGEELSGSPPRKKLLPKEKRYTKTKLRKKTQKKKVKVKVVKKSERLLPDENDDGDDIDLLPPPSPPPGSPPPHIFPARIKTPLINNIHPAINVHSKPALYRPNLPQNITYMPPPPAHHVPVSSPYIHGAPPPSQPPPHHHYHIPGSTQAQYHY